MTDAPLFFLHIPRTGGTSLIEYLDRKMAGAGVCPAHQIFEFQQLKLTGQLHGFGFYRGHFSIDLPDMVAPTGRLITFLRSPVPRIFSSWHHMRATRPYFPAEGARARKMHHDNEAAHILGFREFCEFIIGQGRRSFFNQMTVMLALGQGWDIAAAEVPKVDASVLDRAKRSLDRFSFIGFTEAFDRSTQSLQRQFGWEVEPLPHRNAGRSAIFPEDPALFEWLLDAAEFDVELYNYARQRAGAAMGPHLPAAEKSVIADGTSSLDANTDR